VYTGNERRQLFELNPTDRAKSAKLVDKRRTLIGKAETCDIILDFPDISPVHAILEITKDGNKVYDLNTKSGTFVNGQKVVAGEYKEGDKIKFGSHEFIYKKFVKEELPPPILQMLDPTLPEKFKPSEIVVPVVKEEKKIKAPPRPAYVPKVAYPLGADPKAATSQYIFEEGDSLIPIFDYEPNQSSVEVITHFNDKIFSVDYLPLKNGKYPLVGRAKKDLDIELPLLGKKERMEFLNISGGSVSVSPPLGFESLVLNDQQKSIGPIYLKTDDLVRFYKNNVQILVRLGPKPPFVKTAPFISKDKQLIKILAIIYLLLLILLFFIALSTVDEEKEKEKDKEKAPERIARILNKPKPIIEEKPLEQVAVTPKPEPEKIPEVKKVEVVEAPKPAPKAPPKKATPPQAKVEMKKPIVTQKVSKDKAPPAPPKTKGPKAPPGKIVAKTQPGPVNTFSLNFKANISKTLAKGEQVSESSSSTGAADSEIGVAGGVGSGGATSVKKADIAKGVGSLKGVAGGSLDTAEGVAGLSNKESVYSVGMPGRTVVLGSMDPDLIRKILRDNVPLFSNCYQKELEGSGDISGLVKLNFEIGSSGSVGKASTTTAESKIPQSVLSCVTSVLKGISFPPPMGGGSVEVVQPLNLQPKRI